MKVMSVVGARPNFMKVAPIIEAIREQNHRNSGARAGTAGAEERVHLDHVLVHTGQHYDQAMSGSFFKDLNLPDPDIHLGVGSGSHGAQTAEIMKRFEEVLQRERPDILLVVGDVNSTLACSLVAAKVSWGGSRPLIAHVEAGLRSFDRAMPEEVNRVVTDHVSDLLFVTEESGVENLSREGIEPSKIHWVGNTMIDSVLACRQKAESSAVLERLGLRLTGSENGAGVRVAPFALLTLHRPSNVDNRDPFLEILEGLQPLAGQMPIIFPAHPRTCKFVEQHGLGAYFVSTPSASKGIRLVEPQGYFDFLCLMKNAKLVVTDSGGIQEETTCLGIPCVTVRENTERPITVTMGSNILAGVTMAGIRAAIHQQLTEKKTGSVPKLWDGRAAQRIASIIAAVLSKRQAPSKAVSGGCLKAAVQ